LGAEVSDRGDRREVRRESRGILRSASSVPKAHVTGECRLPAGDPIEMSYVEYVVEKSGLGKVVYFIAIKEEGDECVAGFFPAYMAPTPGEDSDEDIFNLSNPDHTVSGPTREAAADNLRAWVEETYKGKIHERRAKRVPIK